MSLSDPKSKEDLKKLAQKEKDQGSQSLSKNEKWELGQARKYGVKGIDPD